MKKIIIGLLIFFQCQISVSQADSLKFGLKGKIIRALANSPNVPKVFYAGLKGKGTGTGLMYQSNDFGKTWGSLNEGKPISPYVSDIQAIAMATDAKKTMYAGTWKNGLHKSIDKGKTWKRDWTFPSSDVRSIKVGMQNPSLIYVGTSAFGVVKSVDGGKTWKRCAPKVIDSTFTFVWSIEIDPQNDNIVYAQTYNKGVWKSIDQGETWKQILNTKRKVCWDIKISKNSKEIWVATSKRRDSISSVYHSKDKGKTWEEVPDVPQIGISQINVIETNDTNTLILGSWQKGVFVFKNKQWTKIDSVDFDEISEILINDSELLIGSWGNGIYHYKL